MLRLASLAALALLVCTSSSFAQSYPAKPLKLIVAFPPGTPPDIIGRVIAESMGQGLGQQIVVENRPGAAGTIGAAAAANAPPDGYTLHLGSTGSLAVGPALYSKAGFDPVESFAPISLVGTASMLFTVGASVPATDIKAFIEYVRARPGKVNYASAGPGSVPHVAMEMFRSAASPLEIVHVPYKGGIDAHVALMNGDAHAMVDQVATMGPHIRSGKIRPIVMMAGKRHPLLPDVPTMTEAGFAGMDAEVWFGLLAPRGTAAEIVTRLNAATQSALAAPPVRERLAGFGFEPAGGTSVAFATYLRREVDRWARAVRASGAKIE